jgi:hypothetical protein
VTGLVLAGWAQPVAAASEVFVGGYHEQVLQQAQQDLLGSSLDVEDAVEIGGIRISVGTGEAATVTGFTPRFGSFGLGRARPAELDHGTLLKESYDHGAAEPVRREVRIGPDESAEIAGLEVGWSAIAGVTGSTATPAAGASAFMVGGELAVSRLRLDATIGQDPGLLGREGSLVSAGLGYDFGWLDTRLGYSVAAGDEAQATSLLTLGSQLTLQPWLVLQGDVAYAAGEERGHTATAGRLTLRLNF